MRARLLDLVVCPRCGGPLRVQETAREGEEIMEGELACQRCHARFPVTRGIPRLLPDAEAIAAEARATVERFGEQWNRFDFLGEHYEEQFLGWIRPNRPEVFEDEIVLEGGCGKGRHSAIVARWGAKDVLAVDLGSSVEAAFRNTREHPNVHVIQADLFMLPVAARSVGVAFSVGVLHHTPSPKACFRALEDKVRPGGRVIAWVYGRENNGWIVHAVNPIREKVTSKLPFRVVYELSKLPAAALLGLGRGVYQPLAGTRIGPRLFYGDYIRQISRFPFDEVHSIVHDHLTPPIAHYIEGPVFRSWFDEAGLEAVTVEWHNQNSWRGTGLVPEDAPPGSEA
jgi:uncharacterized protein YbaR (Trm112 family)